MQTHESQSGEEYRKTQDLTAPPDPVAEGTTSDVPIHGEKTNILFHPTPSVSYEPTFEALKRRAGVLCLGILVATVVVGKMFGGALKGLIPLGMCLSSGVWLWMKEVRMRPMDRGKLIQVTTANQRANHVCDRSYAAEERSNGTVKKREVRWQQQTCYQNQSNG
jgi:hypothetical protein